MMAEEQRERNVDADDDGAAQIAQEDPLDQEHQQTAENEIVQHRVGGDPDQRDAIVERDDLHARRQAAVVVDSCRPPALMRGHHVVGV